MENNNIKTTVQNTNYYPKEMFFNGEKHIVNDYTEEKSLIRKIQRKNGEIF